jgi:hypothetical protein
MAHGGTAVTILAAFAGFVGAPVLQYTLRSLDFGMTERVLTCWALIGGGAAGIWAGNRTTRGSLVIISDVCCRPDCLSCAGDYQRLNYQTNWTTLAISLGVCALVDGGLYTAGAMAYGLVLG